MLPYRTPRVQYRSAEAMRVLFASFRGRQNNLTPAEIIWLQLLRQQSSTLLAESQFRVR